MLFCLVQLTWFAASGVEPRTHAHLDEQTPRVALDELVKHMTYDGLGRLVRVQSPYPDPSAANGELRTERFHYDGIRRIQEVLTDPLLDTDGAADGGESAAMSALLEEPQLDGSAVTLGSESNQTDGGGPGGGGTPTPAPPAQHLEREYIWGPGDNGLDELLVQFDRQRDAWWVVQDSGLDAIAVCDLGGSGGAARVVWQGTYDAYGAVLSAESLYAHAHTRIGHKGLFFDRLDGGVVEQYTLTETPRLAAGARLAGHVRNRILLPDLGRFAQQDPNATGAMLLASAHAGISLSASVDHFDLQGLYGDSGNLYEYVGTNPWTSSDPLGLFVFGSDALYLGFELGRVAFNLIDQYAADLQAYSMWAEDWSLDDDLFSQQIAEEPWDDFDDDGDGLVSANGKVKAINAGIKAARFGTRVRIGAIYPTYHTARYAIKLSGRKLQAHHIVEVRALNKLKLPTNGPAVVLNKAQHQLITNKLRNEIPYGPKLGTMTKPEIIQAYRRAYEAFPDLLAEALKILN